MRHSRARTAQVPEVAKQPSGPSKAAVFTEFSFLHILSADQLNIFC